MSITPYQLNKRAAAAYCGVSVGKFDKDYRGRLTEMEDGGSIYFLREDLEKLIRERFKVAATWRDEKRRYQASTGTQKPETGSSTRKSKATDGFTAALERRTTLKQNAAR